MQRRDNDENVAALEVRYEVNDLISLLFKLKAMPVEACDDYTCTMCLAHLIDAHAEIDNALDHVEEDPF